MQPQQDVVEQLLGDLYENADHLHRLSNDPGVHMFSWPIYYFSTKLKMRLHEWSALDQEAITKLQSESRNYLLDLNLVQELASLIFEEFGGSFTPAELARIERINEQSNQLRRLINEAMGNAPDSRFRTRLDLPATRLELGREFDNKLREPVRQMIVGIEQLLASDQLDTRQHRYLESAFKNCLHLYRVLEQAGTFIESKDIQSLAMVSYEYRGPFCGITGYFYLLLERDNQGLDAGQLSLLENLISYSGTILGMVNDLINTTRFLVGKYDEYTKSVISENLNLVQIKKHLLSVYESKYPQISFQIDLPETLPALQMDIYELYTCLINLLNNAFKYTTIGQVSLNALCKGDSVLFCVKDTGVGMSKDQQERIFEPFTQVGAQKKGLGLGLFLSRKYAELAQGSLTVDSCEGQGSMFTLQVPIASA